MNLQVSLTKNDPEKKILIVEMRSPYFLGDRSDDSQFLKYQKITYIYCRGSSIKHGAIRCAQA